MKNIILITVICGITLSSVAQQVPLKGVVTVQNSKTNTGQTQYVKNAEVEHTNDKNAKTKDVTGNDGKFTLNIKGVAINTQIKITVNLYGDYADYVVVNEKEIKDLTLGRTESVNVYVCKNGELEQRQAEMVGINMKKLEERLEKDKKRLQKELDELKQKNDYLNARYGAIKDSLDVISKTIDNAFERIKEYAKKMVLENLDNQDENYVKAYNCFTIGELDSVSYYLSDEALDKKHQKILQLQEEAKKEKELAEILTESAKAKKERSQNSLNELIKEWLLLARTAAIKNDYEKTIMFYEKVANADTRNGQNVFEYAQYLYKIKEYDKAKKYYLQCLEIYRVLEKEYPKLYLPNIAEISNKLGLIYYHNNDDLSMGLTQYEEALKINKELAVDNPNSLYEVVAVLNNMGMLYERNKEIDKSLQRYEEALKILREVNPSIDNPQELYNMSNVLMNLGNLHHIQKEYSVAEKELRESLKTRRNLAEKDAKYISKVALCLINLGFLHNNTGDYSLALRELEEALKIYQELVAENPKEHVANLAIVLINLGGLYNSTEKDSIALHKFEEAEKICRELVAYNAKAYLYYLGLSLINLGITYWNIGDFSAALPYLEEALKVRRELAEKNPKAYLSDFIRTLTSCGKFHIENKDFVKSEQYCREALELDSTYTNAKISLAHALLFQNHFAEANTIYKELAKDKDDTQRILKSFDILEEKNTIPEKQKANVEKIRKMLK